MRLLFDTNIYARIAEQGGTAEVSERIGLRRDTVRATSVIWQEIMRAPVEVRATRWPVVFALANEFPPAAAELDAREVRRELRRLRPTWLKRDPDLRDFTKVQRFSKEHWRAVRDDPSWTPPRLAEYEHDAQVAIDFVQANHRARKAQVADVSSIESLEKLWRLATAAVWMSAFDGHPSMRDYVDFLGPFMDPEVDVTDQEWFRFWLEEVDGNQVPRSRAMGLAFHFQAARKTSRGQAMDTLHAAELPSVDAIVTSDANFASALEELQSVLTGIARVIRVSPVDTAQSLLEALPTRS